MLILPVPYSPSGEDSLEGAFPGRAGWRVGMQIEVAVTVSEAAGTSARRRVRGAPLPALRVGVALDARGCGKTLLQKGTAILFSDAHITPSSPQQVFFPIQTLHFYIK